MAQCLYFLPYIAAFAMGVVSLPFLWALALALVSTPLYILMRWEGHLRYGLPMEDWSPASFGLLVFGQAIIQATLYGVGTLVSLPLEGIGLV